MKNTKFSKITLLVLSLALVFGAVAAITASAETNETKPEIISQNVAYSTNLAVKLAVDATTATAPIKLYRFDTEPAVGEVGELVATSSEFVAADSTVNNLPKDSYVIQAPGVAASDIAHYYYYKVVDANGNESDIFRYSVAEYLYERLATAGITDTQKNLYNATIAYGAAAQIQFNSTDPDVSTLNLVTVDGGVVDGYAQGLYATGATVTPVGIDAIVTKWTVYKYDAEGNRTSGTAGSNEPITIEGRTEIIAGEIKEYRPGTYTFEDLNVGDAINGVSCNNGAAASIVKDSVYGKESNVIKLDFNGNTAVTYNRSWYAINKTQGTGTNDDIFEISFDLNVEMPSWGTCSYHLYIGNKYSSPGDYDYKLKFYVYNGGYCLGVENIANSTEQYLFSDINPKTSGYNHIAFQIRRNDIDNGDGTTTPNTSLYFIVNGVEAPITINTEYATQAGTTIGNYKYLVIRNTDNNSKITNSDWYIDNLFMGYVKQ